MKLHVLPSLALVALSLLSACGQTPAQIAKDVTSVLPLACDVADVAAPAAAPIVNLVCSALDASGNVVASFPVTAPADAAPALLAKFPSSPAVRAARAKARP